MAGRQYLSAPDAITLREASHSRAKPTIADARLLHRVAQPSSAALEDRIAIQHREIQSLLVDNQRLAATHVALKQELSATQQDLRVLSAAAASTKAEKDAQVRDVYERSLSMEAEARKVEDVAAELAQVRLDVQTLSASRKELVVQLQAVEDDLAKARLDSKPVLAVKADIEGVNREIQRGRDAIEQEKKTRVHNSKHRQIMEKHMASMASEIEKLQIELANAERRARASVAATVANPSKLIPDNRFLLSCNHFQNSTTLEGLCFFFFLLLFKLVFNYKFFNLDAGYGAISGSTEMVYGGQSYPNPYSMHRVWP
ncbi:protein FLC EXPRESSOR isoform X1 [Cannabis sativa]|uniref:protein FLC EXPRESSOR isoform X1 n=1 Tax=Cannabis sativa TaxID=3483 RepID=UPI0029CA8C15|nr:protein FLC EXPRESSOR isoform X1 [Cannabis sativa]